MFYPNKKGGTFDMAYYGDRHSPLVRRLLGPALKGAAVEQGLGAAPGSPATCAAMGHLLFDTTDAFEQASPLEGGRRDFPTTDKRSQCAKLVKNPNRP